MTDRAADEQPPRRPARVSPVGLGVLLLALVSIVYWLVAPVPLVLSHVLIHLDGSRGRRPDPALIAARRVSTFVIAAALLFILGMGVLGLVAHAT